MQKTTWQPRFVWQVNADDDPFTPFWPGTEYVEWVGTSIYWWGVSPQDFSLGNNLVPYGTYVFGEAFTETYVELVKFGKPIMIGETAAVYNPNVATPGGASEVDIKTAYITSVYNLDPALGPTLPDDFPELKLIVWFN